MPSKSFSRLVPVLLLLLLLAPALVDAADPPATPRAASEALATLRLADPALTIELVACEPDIISPVAVVWDEDGRMYVAEMIDYPVSPAAGRIKRLEDHDGDGRYEKVTVFADGLPYPTSVLPWNGGVLVTAAPNIWYFKDTDGDGRADERKVLFTGFGEGNQQLRVNGLTYGLDNWIYGANGRSDGEIRRPDDPPGKAISIRRRDFRFKPATGEFEAIAGFSQFGLPRDDWGNRFPSWNTIPIRHVVIEDDVLSRNPYLAESTTVATILDTSDGGRVYSISPTQARFNRESVAFFNASCGPTIFRGNALPSGYEGNAFVCEPLTNLVHRRVLVPDGPTFSARRVEQGKEFLASTDSSFRPVNLATGPDGALYVVDMYRELVEHPQFVPEDQRKSIEFRRWYDRGRIWRIRAKDSGKPRATDQKLSRASITDLVALLEAPNGWTRDTAQRLIVERQDRTANGPLSDLARKSKNSLARLHAIWTLLGLGSLGKADVRLALHDENAHVRENAIRISASFPQLESDVIALANDPDARVRFQAAIAFGRLKSAGAMEGLMKIAAHDAGNNWARLAILSGLGDSAWPFLERLFQHEPAWRIDPKPDQEQLLGRIGEVIGAAARKDEIGALLSTLSGSDVEKSVGPQWTLLSGVVDGLARSGKTLRGELRDKNADQQLTLDRMQEIHKIVVRAEQTAADVATVPSRRVAALDVLVRLDATRAAPMLAELLLPRQPIVVQSAAARALATAGQPDAVTRAFERWSDYTTATRREMILVLASNSRLVETLVGAMEQGVVNPGELDATAREALGRVRDPGLRKRIAPLLARSTPPDRGEVIRKYQQSLALSGDAGRGEALFAKNCQTCHQKRGQGHRVGPDLSGVAGRPASALLNDILDPSREVAPDYVGFQLVTKQGLTITGLLAEETAGALKLRRNEGAEETVLRSEIEEFRSTGRSLMPDGLEQALSVQDIADLLEYLRRP